MHKIDLRITRIGYQQYYWIRKYIGIDEKWKKINYNEIIKITINIVDRR